MRWDEMGWDGAILADLYVYRIIFGLEDVGTDDVHLPYPSPLTHPSYPTHSYERIVEARQAVKRVRPPPRDLDQSAAWELDDDADFVLQRCGGGGM